MGAYPLVVGVVHPIQTDSNGYCWTVHRGLDEEIVLYLSSVITLLTILRQYLYTEHYTEHYEDYRGSDRTASSLVMGYLRKSLPTKEQTLHFKVVYRREVRGPLDVLKEEWINECSC